MPIIGKKQATTERVLYMLAKAKENPCTLLDAETEEEVTSQFTAEFALDIHNLLEEFEICHRHDLKNYHHCAEEA